MTNAQILQEEIMSSFFSKLINYTDSNLMKSYRMAQDDGDGRKIKAIREELNRRVREI